MKPRTPTGATRAQVVATVEAWVRAFGHGPTRAELAKRLQISREVAGRHVSKAADAGQLVVATGNGKARRIGLPAMPRGASRPSSSPWPCSRAACRPASCPPSSGCAPC